MAKPAQPQRRTDASLVRLVAFGIFTGSLAWLPFVWWNPANAPAKLATAKPSPYAGRYIQVSGSLPNGLVYDNKAHEAIEPEAVTAIEPTPDNASADTATSESLADAPLLLPPQAERPINTTPIRPQSPNDIPPVKSTAARLGDEGTLEPPLPRRSGVSIAEPEPVSVASYEPPVASGDPSESVTIRLMHDLNDANEQVRSAAEEMLADRGYDPSHLRLAKQLTSAVAAERAALAAQLPNVAGIDARLWLTWLLRDESAEVRLSALSVLATSGDEETLRRALTIARQDRDPRIRLQLEQIEKSRRGLP